MQEIKRRVEELAKMVAERGGACIIFVDPDGAGKELIMEKHGYKRTLAAMIGAAMMSCEDVRECFTDGFESAQYVGCEDVRECFTNDFEAAQYVKNIKKQE